MAAAFFFALTAAACAACEESSSTPSAGTDRLITATTLDELRQRPLHIEKLETGDACPRSRPHHLSRAFGPGLGDGPVYPVGFTKRGALTFEYPPPKNSLFAGSHWGGQKVLWVSKPGYDGPILIRGQQVDGEKELRFGTGGGPLLLPALAFASGSADNRAGGWRNFPSYTRLRAPGCYAYQVDGSNFSDVIFFTAVISASW